MNPTSTHPFPILASFLLLVGSAQAEPIKGAGGHDPAINTARLTVAPSAFEENKGQMRTTAGHAAPFVRYRLTQGNTSIFLLGNGIAYQFDRTHYPTGYVELQQDARLDPAKQHELNALRQGIRSESYRMDMLLLGSDPHAHITTEGRSADHTQYYTYDALDVHTYTRVTYHEVYPGIDWVVYTTEGTHSGAPSGLKYDFVLRPGADPSLIQLRFTDHEELYVDAAGQLMHGNRMGRFTEAKPVSFQNGKEVGTRFVLSGDRLSFALDPYDHDQPLTIDPDRMWATYYGGMDTEFGRSCVVDGSGNVYLAGETISPTGIASGGHQEMIGGDFDAFLVKFNANGMRVWGTYYGGAIYDFGYSCAVDGNGNVYLAGETSSETTIAAGGHQNTYGGGNGDAFLVKFDGSGVRQWGTYYGGANNDGGNSCAVDSDGNVYLSGTSTSGTDISSGGHQNPYGGGNGDAFLVKFNTNGTRLWGTYYGGTLWDQGAACTVDGDDNVFLAGRTESSTAIAAGGHQNAIGGGSTDAFLAKFNASGVRQWGTYYGGTAADWGLACAVDGSGNVYLTGSTVSSTAIASGAHQAELGGSNDAFLVKFDAEGLRQWATYYGGAGEDQGTSCVVDGNDIVYLAGISASVTDIASEGYQDTFGGGSRDAFLVAFNTSGVRQWGTYYGGTGNDEGTSCAVDGSGSVYLAGATASDTLMAAGEHQNTIGGGYDAFLVKFDVDATVGISSTQDREFPITIWPNPNTGDHFFLQAQGSGLAQVRIFDAMGKLQHTEQVRFIGDGTPVEIILGDDLAEGMYLLRCTMDGRTVTAPLLLK